MLKRLIDIASREVGIIFRTPIYAFCMVVFPLLVLFFFTSLMESGQPFDMPVGVVDQDQTTTTRAIVRKLDAFQNTKIAARYPSVEEARQAIQRNEIYAFIYFPKHTTDELLANKQPKISFYYSSACITAGSMLMRDLKTISLLGSASVGSAKLAALGKTGDEIRTFLSPINVDMHLINNPGLNYNYYLSISMPMAIIMLLVFLITVYSLGTELKFSRAHDLMERAGGNIYIAIMGKLIPQFCLFLIVFMLHYFYLYHVLHFPLNTTPLHLVFLGALSLMAGQGLGIFMFGLFPSLRFSMSICALWGSLSFSMMGSTFPPEAMDSIVRTLTLLFPMRHYFMAFQICVFNGYPLSYAWPWIGGLCVFALLPLFVIPKIRKVMLTYVYIP
jgi:ABC-2 type transport system permease protein